jgi:hypothetical protein
MQEPRNRDVTARLTARLPLAPWAGAVQVVLEAHIAVEPEGR